MTKEESSSLAEDCCTCWHTVGPQSVFVEEREEISYPFMQCLHFLITFKKFVVMQRISMGFWLCVCAQILEMGASPETRYLCTFEILNHLDLLSFC